MVIEANQSVLVRYDPRDRRRVVLIGDTLALLKARVR